MQYTHITGFFITIFLSACSTPVSPIVLSKELPSQPTAIATFVIPTPTNIAPSIKELNCDEVQNPQYHAEILKAVNKIRSHPQHCGKVSYPSTKAVIWNDLLEQSATAHAKDISQRRFLSHYGPQGQGLRERIKLTGYIGGAGENLASGQKNVDEVLKNWLSLSPGHCDNLMLEKYKEISLVCVRSEQDQRPYWVLHLGTGKK